VDKLQYAGGKFVTHWKVFAVLVYKMHTFSISVLIEYHNMAIQNIKKHEITYHPLDKIN